MTSFTIHCFGASLTEGYTWIGDNLAFTPFSQFLPDFLATQTNSISSMMKFKIHNYGICGEETSDIRARFESFLITNKAQNQDGNQIFVFLAGTNDLSMSRSVHHAFENMNSMIRNCCNAKNRVVVCSIPSTAQIEDSDLNLYFSSFSSSSLISRRNEYNLRLKQLCQELGGGKAQFFDLFSASGVKLQVSEDEEIDKQPCVIKLNPAFASDNIHLNPAGYRMLAKGVADAIEKLFAFDMTCQGHDCSKI